MKLAKRISLLLLTAMSTTRPVNCLTKGWTVSMKPRVTMFRLYKFWLALLALLFLLNTPQLAQAVDLTAWGPWRYAQTNTDYNPLEGGVAGVALSTGDEVAARFEISDVPSIEVAVFLKSDANFVPEQTTLKVQLRLWAQEMCPVMSSPARRPNCRSTRMNGPPTDGTQPSLSSP